MNYERYIRCVHALMTDDAVETSVISHISDIGIYVSPHRLKMIFLYFAVQFNMDLIISAVLSRIYTDNYSHELARLYMQCNF